MNFGAVTTRTYDAAGQRSAMRDPVAQRRKNVYYDEAAELSSSTDAGEFATTYAYLSPGQPGVVGSWSWRFAIGRFGLVRAIRLFVLEHAADDGTRTTYVWDYENQMSLAEIAVVAIVTSEGGRAR